MPKKSNDKLAEKKRQRTEAESRAYRALIHKMQGEQLLQHAEQEVVKLTQEIEEMESKNG